MLCSTLMMTLKFASNTETTDQKSHYQSHSLRPNTISLCVSHKDDMNSLSHGFKKIIDHII